MLKLLFLTFIICLAFGYADRTERIIGGSNAALGQLPWQASLRSWGTTFHFAGGVLISNRWILTAAHAVEGRATNSINIALGIINLSGTFTNRRSDTITIHPGYNFNTRLNDIACVRSSTAIGFNSNIQPISLVSRLIDQEVPSQVSGWGSIDPNKGPNNPILQVRTVLTTATCVSPPAMTTIPTTNPPISRQYDALLDFVPDDRLNICAEGAICTSDVGGPLSIPGLGLIGIASWHESPCGVEPDVYVRISWYRNWIGSITGV